MSAKLLSGRTASDYFLETLKKDIAQKKCIKKPKLAVVLVGNNSSSQSYIRMKQKKAEFVWIESFVKRLPESIDQESLIQEVEKLSNNPDIHGIIVQLPLPDRINPKKILWAIDPQKDVDGFTKVQIANFFLWEKWLTSCTPKGIMNLLDFYTIPVSGKNITIIGRSNIVGKPLSLLMMNAGATVSVCHSQTKDIPKYTKTADIIVVAVGKPLFLKKEMVHKDAIVIDVGSTFVDGKFCWDADFENLKDFVFALTPAPGGVGPMTVSVLLQNTWKSYRKLQNII